MIAAVLYATVSLALEVLLLELAAGPLRRTLGIPRKQRRESTITRLPAPLMFVAAVAVAFVAVNAAAGAARPDKPPVVRIGEAAVFPPTALAWQLKRLGRQQRRTHACEQALGADPTPTSRRPIQGLAYARWLVARWSGRADATCELARRLGTPVGAIRAVFGVYADQALAVTACESGFARTPRAHNGQYLGMFQMGEYARSTYGHGSTPLEQAIAARRYFDASGRDWSPWSCKP